MKRVVLVRQRAMIFKRAVLLGSIMVGGLMWAYSMLHLAGYDLLAGRSGVRTIVESVGQNL